MYFILENVGGVAGNVLDNDLQNESPAVAADVTITLDNDDGSGATINASGVLTVPSTAPPGPYTITYTICNTLPTPECDTATSTFVVTEGPNLTVNKTASPAGDVVAGDVITYTIEVENVGGTDATNLLVEDVLPAGVTYVPSSASATYFENGAVTTGSFNYSFPANQAFDLASPLNLSVNITATDIPANAIITSLDYNVTTTTTDWLSEIDMTATYPGGTVSAASFGGNGAGGPINRTGTGTVTGAPSAIGTYQIDWTDANNPGGNTANVSSFTINYS